MKFCIRVSERAPVLRSISSSEISIVKRICSCIMKEHFTKIYTIATTQMRNIALSMN